MYAASRAASARARDALSAALTGSDGVAAATGSELFAVVSVLDEQRALRVALADRSVPGAARAELAEHIFGGRVSAATLAVLTTAVAQDWSRTRDLVATLELLGQEALLRAAADRDRIDTVEEELFRLGRLVQANPELEQALAQRGRPAAAKRGLIAQLVSGRVDELTQQLVEQALGRAHGNVGSVFDRLSELAASLRRQVVAHVRAATELTVSQREQLATTLQRIYDTPVTVRVEVAPELLSGAVVRIGDDVIDGSALGRLQRLRRSLT